LLDIFHLFLFHDLKGFLRGLFHACLVRSKGFGFAYAGVEEGCGGEEAGGGLLKKEALLEEEGGERGGGESGGSRP
jgi:hypothetical protein